MTILYFQNYQSDRSRKCYEIPFSYNATKDVKHGYGRYVRGYED